jgi:hypothetical protein
MALQTNAAILPDEEEETGNLKQFETPEADTTTPEPTEPEASETASAPAEDEIPDNLRGKTPAEIARMYLEAQRLIGRQGQELGELRRRTDETIKAVLERTAPQKPAEAPKPPDATDFFTDPEKAVARAVEEHPLVKKLLEENERLRGSVTKSTAERNAERFAQLHPDAGDIIRDPEFQEWIGKSTIRRALFLKAHREYDVVAGDELLGTWKQIRAQKAAAPAAAAKPAARTDASAAAVPTSKSAGSSKSAGAAGGSGKIYRRADILRLMEDDPDRYEALADEIRAAYEQGRVR